MRAPLVPGLTLPATVLFGMRACCKRRCVALVKLHTLLWAYEDPVKKIKRETSVQSVRVGLGARAQDAKREIAEAALGSEGTSGGARLSLNDLRVLFGIRRRN